MQPNPPLPLPPFEPLGRVPADLDPSVAAPLLAEVVDEVGEERRKVTRLLTYVRNGDLPWTYVVADAAGRLVLIHHDAIRRWRLMEKRA